MRKLYTELYIIQYTWDLPELLWWVDADLRIVQKYVSMRVVGREPVHNLRGRSEVNVGDLHSQLQGVELLLV